MSNIVNLERDIVMFERRLQGATFKTLSEKNEISTERVRQAYATMGQRIRRFAMDNGIALEGKCADREVDYTLNNMFWLSVLEKYKLRRQQVAPIILKETGNESLRNSSPSGEKRYRRKATQEVQSHGN